MTRVARIAGALILLLSATGVSADAPEFILLPTPPDGNPESGFFGYSPASHATAVSADGSVVVGSSTSPDDYQAFRWTAAGGVEYLGFLAYFYSEATGVSPDGSVVVGGSSYDSVDWGPEAFRWTVADGMQPLGFLPGQNQSRAEGVSVNGSVIVGTSWGNVVEHFRWAALGGMQVLNGFPGAYCPCGEARAVSADGSVIVGS
ncbi:MAG TPA: PEP-CTERM sorting domain-containing protein, partial [Phycisphaerae bacterium]